MSRPRDKLRVEDGTADLSPPHSVQAEEATLGALLIDGTAWGKVNTHLVTSDFYDVKHRQIYDAIETLAKRGKPHDTVLVGEELERAGLLESSGGFAYLGKLARETASANSIVHYAEIVHERAALRDLQTILVGGQRAIAQGGRLSEILGSAVTALGRLQSARNPQQQAERVLQGISFADMQLHLNDAHLVKGLFAPNTLIGIIGTTGSGKTFTATSLAVHLACKSPWFGMSVCGGLVCYFPLEGPRSAERRFALYRDHRDIPAGIPLKLSPGPINLRSPADVGAVVGFVKQAETEYGENCCAVFVDTLSRGMPGANENDSDAMTAAIAGADAIRLQTGAAVVLVHHLGKDESKGARGHSSLKAAFDTEIEVSAEGEAHVITCTKQRDLPTGGRWAFRLPAIEIGTDSDGDAVTSCFVEPIQTPPPPPNHKGAGKNQVALRAALEEWARTHPSGLISTPELRELGKTQRIPRQRFAEVLDSLTRAGYLTPTAGGMKFNPEAR